MTYVKIGKHFKIWLDKFKDIRVSTLDPEGKKSLSKGDEKVVTLEKGILGTSLIHYQSSTFSVSIFLVCSDYRDVIIVGCKDVWNFKRLSRFLIYHQESIGTTTLLFQLHPSPMFSLSLDYIEFHVKRK